MHKYSQYGFEYQRLSSSVIVLGGSYSLYAFPLTMRPPLSCLNSLMFGGWALCGRYSRGWAIGLCSSRTTDCVRLWGENDGVGGTGLSKDWRSRRLYAPGGMRAGAGGLDCARASASRRRGRIRGMAAASVRLWRLLSLAFSVRLPLLVSASAMIRTACALSHADAHCHLQCCGFQQRQ